MVCRLCGPGDRASILDSKGRKHTQEGRGQVGVATHRDATAIRQRQLDRVVQTRVPVYPEMDEHVSYLFGATLLLLLIRNLINQW
jgi:hypothetical protein